MQSLFRTFIAAILLVALPCLATPQSHDGNDLYVDYNELGWGLNIFHQGDTLFASLFVYGPDGQPKWYTGSSLVGDGVYSGPLYESTGPAFGGPFDPTFVTRRQVGTMSVELGADSGGNYALLNYDVDGTRVSNKKLRPFSFVAPGLSGSYTGYRGYRDARPVDLNMNVALNNGSFGMSTTDAVGVSCTYSGRQAPDGSLFRVDGSYSCTDGPSGTFSMANVDVTRHGFTAALSQSGMTLTTLVGQRTSNSIRGDGYTTDLWFPPDESGWGLNIIEQGDSLFGTLFVYDAGGRPRWYSASNLAYEQCAPPDSASDCWGRYRGALVESTGPFFGTTFNPAAVQRRVVGTMSIDFFGNDTAYLDYTVDGVNVARKQIRRYAFRGNNLVGTYAGHVLAMNGNGDRGMQTGAMTIEVAESRTGITITMRGNKGTCVMRGTRFQYGRQVLANGPYDCGGTAFGQLSLMDVYVTAAGFTGRVDFGTQPGVNEFYPIGRIEAVRTGS
jgi:hypothetical protein